MIVYIPAPSAQPLSDALWGLARPPDVRGAKDTKYLFPWVNALDGSLWLMVDTEYEFNVHAEAVLDGIADILQPFIDAGQLPADTNTVLAALVESKRGRRLAVYEAFPPIFKLKDEGNPNGLGRTRTQLVEEGKLNAPSTIP